MYKSIRYHIRNMAPGTQLIVPAGEVTGNTLRNYASSASADFTGRKYSVNFNKVANTYTVTRTA